MDSSLTTRITTLITSKHEKNLQLLLFLLLIVCFTYFFPRWADWSQNSRLNLTLAIVDLGSLSIDPYVSNTGDYALFEGRYYTDKAPGPSFLAVPVYAAVRPILKSDPFQNILIRMSSSAAFADTLNEEGTGLLEDKLYFATVLLIVTFVCISIPAAFLGILIYRFTRYLGASPVWAVTTVLIYGLATNAFPYSGAFFSHQLSAFLLFGAFYIGFLVQHDVIHPGFLTAAGFMLGYSLISEYPTFLIAVGIFAYIVFSRKGKRWIGALLAGGFVPGLLLMVYNWAIFRTPLPVGYRYSELYVEQHSVGLISISYPRLEALWGITFSSYRGLFFVSPVLLLAIFGLILWWRWGKFRKEAIVCSWSVVIFFLFNASSVMWQGGFSIGPRYLIPMLPFLIIGLCIFLIHFGDRSWAIIATGVTSLVSMLIIWAQTIGGQNYPDWRENPLINYSIPYLLDGNIARNWGMAAGLSGWLSLIPLFIIIIPLGYLLFHKTWSYSNKQPSRNDVTDAPR